MLNDLEMIYNKLKENSWSTVSLQHRTRYLFNLKKAIKLLKKLDAVIIDLEEVIPDYE